LALSALAILLLVGSAYILLRRPHDIWTGLRIENDKVVKVASYSTLEACKIEIGKTGGSCGRNCVDYPQGQVADCNPLVTIPKDEGKLK
jgi:hypothetical protein